MSALRRSDYLAPFRPHPWQVAPWLDKSRVLLLTGSAGGGKSRLAGEKVHGFLKKYPNSTGIILRKTRESISKSSMLLMDRTVIGNDTSVRKVPSEHLFYYDNGSILAFGGMADSKQAEQIRSVGQDGKVDIIWMEEGTQFQETDFNELLPRLRGTAASWRQIIITTNPDAPLHWINKRLIMGGEASVFFSGAKDNPANPSDYLATLESLTGVQYDRLVLGKWSQAEGVVYDNWTDANVSDEAEYNPALRVAWGVDDGYAYGGGIGTAGYHPRVVLLMQETAQGGVNVFAEYVATGELPETTIANVLSLPYASPDVAYIDSSAAELKARLFAGAGITTYGSTHIVTEGIKNVRRLICDGSDVRLLRVHPRCTHLINEMLSYAYDQHIKAINGELRPAKLNDHALDALRYALWHLRYE
jgi:phage terminase large subunit